MGKKTVMILATGGTIAGSGKAGRGVGYKVATLTAESLIESVPQIQDLANIKAEQLFNLGSDNITQDELLQLANRVNELEKDDSVDGIVITHGTDTMEENSYFLNLVCDVRKPVVFTGSMRPATAISADGPLNLYQSILVATHDDAVDKPVMCVMSDTILDSRTFFKTSTFSVETMKSAGLGHLGIIRDQEVIFTSKGDKSIHTSKSEFRIDGVEKLPKVSVVYFHIDADVKNLEFALENSDGVVVAGAGEGSFSRFWREVIDNTKKPVVISSRTASGTISEESLLSKNSIATQFLNPQKAAVLLRVALINNLKRSNEDIDRIFRTY